MIKVENNIWIRGRRRLTPEERIISEERQKKRIKIANYVSRNPDIDRSCVICGKQGRIMHNEEDPYYISFICNDCAKSLSNLTIAEESRRDVRLEVNKEGNKYSKISDFTDEEVKRIMLGFLNGEVLTGEYCENVGITRYQFNGMIKRYEQLFPNQKNLIKQHRSKLQGKKLSEVKMKNKERNN